MWGKEVGEDKPCSSSHILMMECSNFEYELKTCGHMDCGSLVLTALTVMSKN